MEAMDIEIELLIQAILMRYQYDFRQYSRTSLKRRLQSCLEQFDIKSIGEIQSRLLAEPMFFSVLLNYLTVNTTSMFRDPEYYSGLQREVIPYLKTYPSLKIWIAGCSTGEEVYSIAILLQEAGLLAKTIIYATDINPANLEKAKRGVFENEEVKKASLNYQKAGGKTSLSDYYRSAYGACQFDPGLIKNTLFSDHSLATDSVFAEVHFVSCRNVLIYFDRPLQDRAIGLYYNSLIQNGFLGLGSKESLHFSAYKEKFRAVVPELRIFQKKAEIA
jgi:chemotaxis protein methyltransferase CheR